MKLARFIISVITIVIVIDLLMGVASKYYVNNHTLPGDYQPIDYLIKQTNEDIILLGSSVVLNSVMPAIIEDSLNMSCYNGGGNGQHLIFCRTMLDCILKRYTPKMIILGMRPDELASSGLGRYNLLVPYYHTGFEIVDSCLESKTSYEKYLMASSLYRYNTIWFRILLYHFITPDTRGEKGYVAKQNPLFPPEMTTTKGAEHIDENRLADFMYIVNICKEKEIDVVVYFPPTYTRYVGQSISVDKVKTICSENNIPCFYDAEDTEFLQHSEWFFDNVHLTKDGGLIYSQQIAHRLVQLLHGASDTDEVRVVPNAL